MGSSNLGGKRGRVFLSSCPIRPLADQKSAVSRLRARLPTTHGYGVTSRRAREVGGLCFPVVAVNLSGFRDVDFAGVLRAFPQRHCGFANRQRRFVNEQDRFVDRQRGFVN